MSSKESRLADALLSEEAAVAGLNDNCVDRVIGTYCYHVHSMASDIMESPAEKFVNSLRAYEFTKEEAESIKTAVDGRTREQGFHEWMQFTRTDSLVCRKCSYACPLDKPLPKSRCPGKPELKKHRFVREPFMVLLSDPAQYRFVCAECGKAVTSPYLDLVHRDASKYARYIADEDCPGKPA